MFRQEVLECGKSIRRNIKRGDFNIREKFVKLFGLEYDFGQRLVTHTLTQHCATVESDLLVFIPMRMKNA